MAKLFQVKGKFLMGEKMQPFFKELKSDSEKSAAEAIYSELGSRHKTPRSKIKIEEIKVVDNYG